MRIRRGKLIPRDDGKRIEELVGAATTGTRSVSVARMLAPPGWSEPAQRPDFDEVVVVLTGVLTLVVNGRPEHIGAGEAGFVSRRSRVVYRNEQHVACDYISVCAPAFRPKLARMEKAPPSQPKNQVEVRAAHPGAKTHAARLRKQAEGFLYTLGIGGCELSVSLVGDRAIRLLNRVWRHKDKTTDVLSFSTGSVPRGAPGPRPLGDIVISLPTAQRAAKESRRPLEEELARYLAHGLLHLLGYDHHRRADAKQMSGLERKLLGKRGMISHHVA
ncbi:MAG: rRNA maturation RNase YbeY [Myxococcota bacterium]